MKTWKLYCTGYNRDRNITISGETLEDACRSRLEDLKRFQNGSNNDPGEVTGFEIFFDDGIIGGKGGYVCRIFYKAARPYVDAPYDIDEYNDIWIYKGKEEKTNRIKEAREKAGMSRAEMSRIFEIPIRTLENWDTGTEPPAWAEKLILEKLETMIDGN